MPERLHRITSYDVAKAAGVSQSTVSRCFLPGSEMAPATRARIQHVAKTLGYVPNAIARSLITRRSEMVAVIVTDFTLATNPAIVAAIGRALARYGKQLLLMAVDDDAAAQQAVHAALRYPLDGLVLAAVLPAAAVKPFLDRGVPVVAFNRPAALPRIDRVATDHAAAAAEVGARLAAAGHRRLLCMAGPAGWPVTEERAAGFLQRPGTAVPVVHSGPTYAAGRAAFLGHVREAGAPDAVFCVNDPLAFGVLDACRFDLGLDAPGDISVIGFDDLPEAAHQSYGLTTVQQPIEAMAETAVELLLRRLLKPTAPAENRLHPGTLISRASARLNRGDKPAPASKQ